MPCLPRSKESISKPSSLVKLIATMVIMSVLASPEASADDKFDPGLRNVDTQKSLPSRERIDQIDTHTGNLLVRHVDLSWKGNGGLDIVINRNYDLRSSSAGLKRAVSKSFRWSELGAGWTMLVAPRWAEHKLHPTPPDSSIIVTELSRLCSGAISPFNTVPDGGAFIELPSGEREALISLGNGRAITKGNWKAECVANRITLRSPDGLAYDLGDISTAWGGQDGPATMFAVTYILPARRVTDPSGNWLTFDYVRIPVPTPAITGLSATRITASDGRQIDFTYDQGTGRLQSMQDNAGRTWSYQHSGDSGEQKALLSVTLPDNETWRYSYAPGPLYGASQAENAKSMKLETMTYPEGGIVRFEVEPFNDQWVSAKLGGASVAGERIRQHSTSIGGTWSYTYAHGLVGQYDVTTVTGPEGVTTYKYMGAGYVVSPDHYVYVDNLWRFGQLMEKSDDAGNVETNTWSQRELSPSPVRVFGPELVWDRKIWAADLAERKIVRNGASYTAQFSGYDSYGNAGTVTEIGPSGETRTTTNTYYTDVDKWIIGRLKNESNAAGSTTREFDSNGRLLMTVKDGVPTSHTYDNQGNVATTTGPRGLVRSYSNFKRGTAQTETQPEGIAISRIVSDAGNVESETNGEGKTSTFRFDGMNRMTEFRPPVGAATTITYGPNSKEATRGALVERAEYDEFGRTESTTLGGIMRKYRYDSLGRNIFQSDPGSDNGVSFEYDRLNRVIRAAYADGTNQVIVYSGTEKLVYDNRQNLTTYSYRSYGNPAEQILMRVTTPEPAASITIGRRADDLVGSITQAGMTRSYDYNANKFLTSVTNPETGTTNFGRDAAGNMVARSVGASGTTAYTFDGQNRLVSAVYPGNTPAVTKTYTKTNKLQAVVSSVASRTYRYDGNDNLVSETVTIDAIPFTIGYTYNDNDQLASIAYPKSGRVVNYSPDVLGRPANVSGYVNAIVYWPSGQVRQIDYANGTVTKYGQHSRLWPNSFSTYSGSSAYVDSSYSYDGMGNLTSIIDTVDGGFNRTLDFDKINRLTVASGPWGTGSIAYDGNGNLTQQALGAHNLQYAYDTRNRLTSVSGARVVSYTYDAYGNIASGAGNTYSYDGVPNLRCVNCADPAVKVENAYDGLNQRVWVSKGGVKSYEVYSAQGNELIEYTPQPGNRLVEYTYLGGKRIAQRVSK